MKKSRVGARYRLIAACGLATLMLAGCGLTQQRPQNSRLLRVISGQVVFVDTAAWSPNSERIAVGGGTKPIRIWNAANGSQEASIPIAAGNGAMSWSPDGKYLAIAAIQPNNKLQVWDVVSEQVVFKDNPGAYKIGTDVVGGADEVAWSPDGKTLAVVVGGRSNEKGTVDGAEILLYNTSTWIVRERFTYENTYLWPVAWSPDGSELAIKSNTAELDKTELLVWDTVSDKPRSVAKLENSIVYDLYWSRDGKQIAIGANDTQVVILDADSGEIEKTFDQSKSVTAFSWSPDGSKMAIGSQDIEHNVVTVWDVSSEKVLYELDHLIPLFADVKWSPDGSYLATITQLDNALWIWDAK